MPSEVLKTQLATTRRDQDLTQEELAQRLTDMGSPIDRSVIGKIEAGKRGVSIDELFAFAAALGVSPMSLVVPRTDEKMRVAPAVEADAGDVLRWARNMRPLPPQWSLELEQRFFDAVPIQEAAAYRRSANLRHIMQMAASLLMVSSWEDETHRSNGVLNTLAHLANYVQREWQDNGFAGTALGAVEAQKKTMTQLTAYIYEQMEKN